MDRVTSYAHEQPACIYVGAEKQPDGRLMGWREFQTNEDLIARSVFNVRQDVRQLGLSNIGRNSLRNPYENLKNSGRNPLASRLTSV